MLGYITFRGEVIRVAGPEFQVGVEKNEAGHYVAWRSFPSLAAAQEFIAAGKPVGNYGFAEVCA